MTPEMVMSMAYQGMKVTLFLAASLLLTALTIGLLVSLFQAATRIERDDAVVHSQGGFAALVLAAAGMRLITQFTTELFRNIPHVLG